MVFDFIDLLGFKNPVGLNIYQDVAPTALNGIFLVYVEMRMAIRLYTMVFFIIMSDARVVRLYFQLSTIIMSLLRRSVEMTPQTISSIPHFLSSSIPQFISSSVHHSSKQSRLVVIIRFFLFRFFDFFFGLRNFDFKRNIIDVLNGCIFTGICFRIFYDRLLVR